MTRIALLFAALFVSGCQSGDPTTDLAGNVYPPVCTVAASVAEPATRIAMDPVILETLGEAYGANGRRLLGYWSPPFGSSGVATIFYDDTAIGWELADLQRHEGCHGVMWRLTGDAKWHN